MRASGGFVVGVFFVVLLNTLNNLTLIDKGVLFVLAVIAGVAVIYTIDGWFQ